MKKEENQSQEKKLTLQELFVQLDEVVKNMEQGEVSLEESFEFYHKGMDLLKACNDRIDKVEKKMILLDNEGEEHEFEN